MTLKERFLIVHVHYIKCIIYVQKNFHIEKILKQIKFYPLPTKLLLQLLIVIKIILLQIFEKIT